MADSKFSIVDGGTTSRCPSPVKECRGAQFEDGQNDVAWMNLGGCCTLGVTWFNTATDEADMAMNTRFDWNGTYDAETVFLHEGGHVAGLGATRRFNWPSCTPRTRVYARHSTPMILPGWWPSTPL